jgi:RNA polymerase sigma-70 factor (ECF subfamily)
MTLDSDAARILAAARRAWPEITVSDDVFAAAVRAQGASHQLHAADLYLALACLHDDARAIRAFDALVAAAIERPVRRILGDSADVDDIRQRVCERLLVPGDDGTPRLANYNATVGLAGYVRVVAARMAIDEHRKRARLRPLEDTLVAALESFADPRLAELKSRYVERFKAAVAGAIAKLSDRDRGVLRLTVEHDLTAADVGRIYHVHRVTVARWLKGIRDQLTRDILESLGVQPRELASMLGLIRSQLSLSINRLLGG